MSPQQFLQLGPLRLEYRQLPAADPSRPTLVLLHEGLGSAEQWKDFPLQLAQASGYGVITYSRQGYGQSSPVNLPRPLNYLSSDGPRELRQLLDALQLSQVVLLGHSDGASIVLAYAATNDPRVLGSIALAPHVIVEAESLDGIRHTTEAWHQGELRDRLARHHGTNVDGAFYGWSDSWLHPDFSLDDLEAQLACIEKPLLVIQGRDDHYATPEQLVVIQRQVAGPCRCVLLDDCRHSPQTEAPERTLQLIGEFLEHLPTVI
ncbi:MULTISPECIES: alpha/beta fold hydrolase [unclassified Pseudomonas]|jgi:pimeloyl-ACP methyl ester carboxylesterase|uniref:alpha/beta fold hydrolase n=1 Tax=unclassified Pseudomonas TaxID=196821 RepID=UPI00029D256E|nr:MULTISPECIES: alpha/beta hydrolase [unclassified Pseudomonas]AFY19814.1 alpha/beta hydrolase fold family protein [Pseudomonas sp. UW4]PBJ04777.1 Proline iminopeptidase [Pseudomonas sp. ACN5]PMZ76033.1 acetoin dehydrogenase dihydrolipoyllysine-residue acetyltransferase subunit [Pseudomonas sp. FW305-70]